jgi:hypothetical protein
MRGYRATLLRYRPRFIFLLIEACKSPISSRLPLSSFSFTPTSLNSPSDRSSIALRLSSSLIIELRAPANKCHASATRETEERVRDSQRTVHVTHGPPEGPASCVLPFALSFTFRSFSFAAAAFFACSSEGTRTYQSVDDSSGITNKVLVPSGVRQPCRSQMQHPQVFPTSPVQV